MRVAINVSKDIELIMGSMTEIAKQLQYLSTKTERTPEVVESVNEMMYQYAIIQDSIYNIANEFGGE